MAGLIQEYWGKLVARIKARRKSEKISQKDLAAITGVSFQTISRFEQAEQNIQLSTLLSICDNLKLKLELQEPYSFRLMIFKILVDGIRQDPYFIAPCLCNADPGHSVYLAGSRGEVYSFPQDDNETKNPVYIFMKSVSEQMLEYQDIWQDYPPIETWQDFCKLVYASYHTSLSYRGKA